ncbi:MAG: bifunctional oligoribonuclease/PAP phosphatase NrnA [Nitrososphaerales archaeon]
MNDNVPAVFDLFSAEFSQLEHKHETKIAIFAHRQADPDAVCAAAGLTLLLQRAFPERNLKARIVAPQGVSVLGEKVCSTFHLRVEDGIEPAALMDEDLIVAVDSGDIHLLEPYADPIARSPAKKILIDHHIVSPVEGTSKGFDHAIIDSHSTSTCEIIARGFPPNIFIKEIARILLTGLMFDSQHLGLANERTLEAALTLVRAGADISDSKRILRYKPDRSELLARLKAAQRLQFEECNGYLIVRSEVSSFQASVARMLVEIGADVAIAYGENGEETRMSARSSQIFYRQSGIDLALEIRKAAGHFMIEGGGHSTASSISGKVDSNVLAEYFVNSIKGMLLQK